MNIDLSALDRKILNLLQQSFPISSQPYAWLAKQLDITEAELLERIAIMKKAGIIRRIGAVMDSKNLGFSSTLCACRADADDIERVAAIINALPGVTHNYQRDHDFNLWFTLTCENEEALQKTIKVLEHETGCDIISMPATRVYKIRVALDMGENNAI